MIKCQKWISIQMNTSLKTPLKSLTFRRAAFSIIPEWKFLLVHLVEGFHCIYCKNSNTRLSECVVSVCIDHAGDPHSCVTGGCKWGGDLPVGGDDWYARLPHQLLPIQTSHTQKQTSLQLGQCYTLAHVRQHVKKLKRDVLLNMGTNLWFVSTHVCTVYTVIV